MSNRAECISKLRKVASYIKENYGVESLLLFGSMARGDNRPDSDIDLFVSMPPKAIASVSLKLFLEEVLDSKIDLIRNHNNLNPVLLKEINRDGIRIF